MPRRAKVVYLILLDALKHWATTANDTNVVTTSLRGKDGQQVIENDNEEFASLSWSSSSSQHSEDSPESSQLPQHYSGVIDGEEWGMDEDSFPWSTEMEVYRYEDTDDSFDESDGEDAFKLWTGDEYDRTGFLGLRSTSRLNSRNEEGAESEFEDMSDGGNYYYGDESTLIDPTSSSEMAEKDMYRYDEEYEDFIESEGEQLEGVMEADERILQSNQCLNRYRQLKRRLEAARPGQTVPMTCGRYCADSNQPIAVRSNSVTLSCNCPNGSCIIDKMGRPRRIMTVWGNYFSVQNVEFRNAVTPQGGGAAILNHGVQATISQCTFRNLRAPRGEGGALYSRASGSMLIQDSVFVNNEARIGGAASVERGRSDRLGRDRGTANTASVRCAGLWFAEENRCVNLSGGGPVVGGGTRNCVSTYDALRQRLASGATDICIRSNSQIVVPNELFLTTDRATLRCSDPFNYFGRVGSCILTKQGGRGRILTVDARETVIEGISFQQSQNLGNDGGALLVKGDMTIIRNCDFRENKATRGGAIFAEQNMQVSLTGCSFQQNEAVRGGAGFFYFTASQGVTVFGSNTLANNGLIFTGVNNFASGNSARQCSYLYQEGTGLCIIPS